ncbi:unnamed protein product [Calypogeia fissa]
MEVVVRRKGLNPSKDKYESFLEAEVPNGPQIALWRSWTFCLLVGCIFTITAGLWSANLCAPYVSTGSTSVTVKHQQVSNWPAITSEEVGIPLPNPMPSVYVQDAVLFPDNVMLLVRVTKSLNLEGSIDSLDCRFGGTPYGSVNETRSPVISIRPRTKYLQIVRCARPENEGFPSKLHNNVSLGIRDSEVRVETNALYHPRAMPSWEALVYEALIDTDTVILLAKGLVSRSSRKMDTTSLTCVFGTDLPSEIVYETSVVTAAQEVIRCEKPGADLDDKLRGLRVSINASWLGVLPSVTYYDPDGGPRNFLASFLSHDFSAMDEDSDNSESETSLVGDFQIEDGQVVTLESERANVAETSPEGLADLGNMEDLLGDVPVRRKLCACTMVWNKARFIREWVMFHSFMGVEKYFVYDNDSDDDTEEVLHSLADYNVSRMVWPWIKTQQAAFSHCTILARDQCEWVLFTDVDEYIYPYSYLKNPRANDSDALVLHRLIDGEIDSALLKRRQKLGQIQFDCNNFGPSGLKRTPNQGVTVGYTCRVKSPERHKSVIMLDALDNSLLNVLHHFDLREGYHNVKLNRRVAVCNHYKYQAWDAFKMKFVRRAGTYTTDWQKNEGRGSHDRTPGLGTKAEKPADWETRFCQVQDKGLRDFSLRTFALPGQPERMTWQVDDEPETHEADGLETRQDLDS